MKQRIFLVAFLSLFAALVVHAEQVGTAFTYQGQLQQSGQPFDGTVDLELSLWTEATNGQQLGQTMLLPGVIVNNGLFNVRPDFGVEAFDGSETWLEIVVEGATLAPRQPLTATPYAIQTRGLQVDQAGDLTVNGTITATAFAGDGSALTNLPEADLWSQNGNDIYYSSGNVGIGVAAPGVALDVNGNVSVAGVLDVQGVILSSGSFMGITNGDNQVLALRSFPSFNYVQIDVDGIGHTGDDIIIGDLNSAANKVGIGTSSPGNAIPNALLEVNGGHIVVANNFGFFSNHRSGSGIGAGIDTRSDDGMAFYTDGGSKMTLTATGQLGIGTVNPSEALDVAGGFRVDGSTFNVDETNNRVGIGTTSPDTHLEILSGSDPTARITHSSSGEVILDFKRNSGSDWRIRNSAGILLFGQSSDNLSSVTDVFRLGGGSVTPAADNAVTLGQSSRRWTSVWAVDGTINTSDARLKKDIRTLETGLGIVNQLNPVSYKWADGSMDKGQPHTGFIAQELQQTLPHVVVDHEWVEIPDTGQKEWVKTEHLGVNYSELIPILTKAIQEQQQQIEALQAEVSQLKELVQNRP
jgi:hypothetical protein